jgi:Ras family protein T1
MFYFAQKAVLHPSAPLWNYAAKDLTEACKRALTLIFKICDMDNDGAMSDAGRDFQSLKKIIFLLL